MFLFSALKNCSIKLMLPIKYWLARESLWHPPSPQPRACTAGWLFKGYCTDAKMQSCCKHQNNVIMRELSVCCLHCGCSSFLLSENVNMWALKESLASLSWNLILKSQLVTQNNHLALKNFKKESLS